MPFTITYFENAKKKIKYYEIFLLEKKQVRPFNVFNMTLIRILFFFFPVIGLLELVSRM